MYKIHLNLDELTFSLLFFMNFDNKFKITLVYFPFYEMEKQYMAKFALVFYGFLVFGNTITTFLISYRISVLLERILQCLTVFFNRVFVGNTQHVHLFFHIYFF